MKASMIGWWFPRLDFICYKTHIKESVCREKRVHQETQTKAAYSPTLSLVCWKRQNKSLFTSNCFHSCLSSLINALKWEEWAELALQREITSQLRQKQHQLFVQTNKQQHVFTFTPVFPLQIHQTWSLLECLKVVVFFLLDSFKA